MTSIYIDHQFLQPMTSYIIEMGVHVTRVHLSNSACMNEFSKYLPNAEIVITGDNSYDPFALIQLYPKVNSIWTGSLGTPASNLSNLSTLQCSQIKEINKGSQAITVHDFSCFPNLERLKLPGMRSSRSGVAILTSTCLNLKFMEISIRDDKPLEVFQHLLISLPQLEHFETQIPDIREVLYEPIQITHSSLRVLKITMPTYNDVLFHLLADCKLVKLQELQLRSQCSYTTSNRLSMIRFLSSCKRLRIFDYDEIKLGNQSGNTCILYDVLYAKLPNLQRVSVNHKYSNLLASQVKESGLTPSSLKTLSLTRFEPNTTVMLKYCPFLTHLTMRNTTNSIDFKLLYESCPNLRSIIYEGKEGYELFNYSHEKLEEIVIHGQLHDPDNIMDAQDVVVYNDVSFPSLSKISINGSIDPQSWSCLLFSCKFNVVRFEHFGMSFNGEQLPILDSLLHHSNFRGLRTIVCDLDVSHCRELEKISEGRISVWRKTAESRNLFV